MSPPNNISGEAVWDLPPLILHPFNERIPPTALLENSKAALMAAGLIPRDGTDSEELARRLLAGRLSEIRMLFFLGKDVLRWIGQCLEITGRTPGLNTGDVKRQSFGGMLAAGPPEAVREKLVRWGVGDYTSIFRRAIGLNTLFAEPPALASVAEDFLRNYHRTADLLFQCFMESEPHRIIPARNCRFELYASGEYTKMLESEWAS